MVHLALELAHGDGRFSHSLELPHEHVPCQLHGERAVRVVGRKHHEDRLHARLVPALRVSGRQDDLSSRNAPSDAKTTPNRLPCIVKVPDLGVGIGLHQLLVVGANGEVNRRLVARKSLRRIAPRTADERRVANTKLKCNKLTLSQSLLWSVANSYHKFAWLFLNTSIMW